MRLEAVLAVLICQATAVAGIGGSPALPFSFVENKGQAEPGVRYLGNGPEFKAWFHSGGVTFQQGNAKVHFSFAGALPDPVIEPMAPLGATANYLRGRDAANWHTELPLFSALYYRRVWAGIDVRFTGTSHLKTEYVVAPHSSPDAIRIRFDGHAAILRDGSLIVTGKSGEYRENKPILFQGDGPERTEVSGNFRLDADGSVGFDVGPYDRERVLTIDPTIVFSGYFGGSAQSTITAIGIDSAYNTVVAGWTTSTDLPASNGARSSYAGGVDAFVASFNPAGGTLNFCTYLGGSADDRAFALALDGNNNIYVTGWTSSSNFPTLKPIQPRIGGARDAFVAELNAAGNALVFSTYLGGSGVDSGYGIALDSANAIVVTGDTTSTNLPTTAGVIQPRLAGGQDAFIAKLAAGGGALSAMTYFGGNSTDHSAAVKLDASNSIFLGGSTFSTNFPTVSAAQAHSGGGQDAFVAKVSADCKTLIFSTYFGGSGGSAGAPEEINAIAMGPGGNLIVGGTTSSIDLPIGDKPIQASFGGGSTDGFMARFYGVNGALQYSTYIGGSSDDGVNAVVVDFAGNVFGAGYTSSTDFFTQNPQQSSNHGGMDAFVIKHQWTRVMYSTYLGGQGNDSANAIAVDSMTSAVVAGTTGSSNFPIAASGGNWPGASLSSFITKLAPSFIAAAAAAPGFVIDTWHNTGYNGPNVTLTVDSFGLAGDIPVAGDWTGSGVKRIGVFRSGTWLLDINGDGVLDAGDKTVSFGQAGDLPLVGDWTGTGTLKLGLFRQGTFILDLSGHLSGVPTGISDASYAFGLPGDIPVVSDWNRSGTAKIGVFRNGYWLVDYNGDGIFNSSDQTYNMGQAGDIPVIGDWNGSGLPLIGVYRNGIWILDYAGVNGIAPLSFDLVFAFGSSGYTPLVM